MSEKIIRCRMSEFQKDMNLLKQGKHFSAREVSHKRDSLRYNSESKIGGIVES